MRHQVLFDCDCLERRLGRHSGPCIVRGAGIKDCATKAEAQRWERVLKLADGVSNVKIWDTRDNPISKLLKF